LYKTPTTFVGPISNKDIINLAKVGRNITIVANATIPNIKQIQFSFDGVVVRRELAVPYAIGGDISRKFLLPFPKLAIIGNHTVTAEAFHANGTIVERNRVRFVVDDFIEPVLGELRKWHKVTLAFVGPFANEKDDVINPFLDYRFEVLFNHNTTMKQYKVPGYFAADGNSSETGATSGDQWFCHFAPDEIGIWTYTAIFVTGLNIATSTTEPGTPTSLHGHTGSFNIQNTNKVGRDHRGKGRLTYVGKHHMRFAETGEWFLKVGADRYVDTVLFFIPSLD
jgi:hypothetical protein